jgi:hypothetical protein
VIHHRQNPLDLLAKKAFVARIGRRLDTITSVWRCCLLSWWYPRFSHLCLVAPFLYWYLSLCFNGYVNSSLHPDPNNGPASHHTTTPLVDICIGVSIGKRPLVLHPSPCDLNGRPVAADTVYVHFVSCMRNFGVRTAQSVKWLAPGYVIAVGFVTGQVHFVSPGYHNQEEPG